MDVNEAVNILIEGVVYAQSKGVYTLFDAKKIAEALEVIESITNPPAQPEQPQPAPQPQPQQAPPEAQDQSGPVHVIHEEAVAPQMAAPIPPTNGGFVQ